MKDETEIRIEDPDDVEMYHPCTWLDFRSENRDDPETVAKVGALRPGEDVLIGGGALPLYRIRRVGGAS